ncbi:MAG: glycosyltransferase [Pseudomonadota bacterium]
MTTILVYPAFEDARACADFAARLSWHLRPYEDAIASLVLFGPQDAIDLPQTASTATKIVIKAAPAAVQGWDALLGGADHVLVWKQTGDVALPKGPRTTVIDGVQSDLARWAFGHFSNTEDLLAEGRAALAALRETVAPEQGYLIGEGASARQAKLYGVPAGASLLCGDATADAQLIDDLQPVALVLGDASRHVGPSAAAVAFRERLAQQLRKGAFPLFVPLYTVPLYREALPQDLQARVRGVPSLDGEADSLDLTAKFAARPLNDVTTHLGLPLAATLFKDLGLCGLDGTSPSHFSAFEGTAPATRELPLSEADYADYCKDMKRLLRILEQQGRSLVALTPSFVPALRERGAAEPLLPAPEATAAAEASPVILSITPDLRDRIGHFWNYELRLAPKVESGGYPYWIAANADWADSEPEVSTDQAANVDCSLLTFSWTLANKPEESEAYIHAMSQQVMAEFRLAIGRALAATPGRLHVYMYCGSLEHAAIFYELARQEPRLSAHVNLFWFRTAEAWKPDFLKDWMWLLRAAHQDPQLTITAMTAHQSRQIEARAGIRLDVAVHPSPLIGDKQALELFAKPRPARPRKRIFFPSANRPEKGTGLLFDSARLLVERLGDQDLELLFRTSPFDPKSKPEEDPLFPYVTLLDGHIEESAFIEAMRGSDAIVLPYLPPDFADRTSGIVIDALYAGAPTVVMRGTFLAEVVETYGCGRIIDEGRPEEVVAAIADILEAEAQAPQDLREGAKRYFRANSWQQMAQEVISSLPSASLPASQPNAGLILLGQLPRAQGGFCNPVAACLELLGDDPAKAAALQRQEGLVLQLLEQEGPGPIVAATSRAAELAKTRAATTDLPIAVVGADLVAQTRALRRVADGSAPKLLLGGEPAQATTLASLASDLNASAVVLPIDGEVGSDFADAAAALAKAGYQVLFAEDHPRLQTFEVPIFRRLLFYPQLSDLPWARGSLIALRSALSLPAIRAAVVKTGRHLAYQASVDPVEIGVELLAEASPAHKDTTIASAGAPNEAWQLYGFDKGESLGAGFTRLTETETLRVHRTGISFSSRPGEPLTFAVDLVEKGRRFLVLWLTNDKNQPRAEAVFDLRTGRLLSSQCFLSDIELFAVAVPLKETFEDGPVYRAWLSLDRYPDDEKLQAQLVTRMSAVGSLQHIGEAHCGLLARRFLVEAKATPSRYPGS